MGFRKFFLFIILLLFLILGSVNASEDVNDTCTFSVDDCNDSFVVHDNLKLDCAVDSEDNQNGIMGDSIKSDDELKDNNEVSAKRKILGYARNFDRDWDRYCNFEYGKTLRIVVCIYEFASDGSMFPTGNVTAMCNGKIYQGISGEYIPIRDNMERMNNVYGSSTYNYLFEITDYTQGNNEFEFFYSGDENYNNYSFSTTFKSYVSCYNESDYMTGNKTAYFKLAHLENFEISTFYDVDSGIFKLPDFDISYYYWAKSTYHTFEFGKPLKIVFDLECMGVGIPTGNVTAICNGDRYDCVFGNYTTYTYFRNGGYLIEDHIYNCLIEITNYTMGENLIEFIYSGDENYSSFSYLTTFESQLSDYDNLIWHVGKNSANFGLTAPWTTFNLYDATGNLTVIWGNSSMSYNLSGEYIIHKFTNFLYFGSNNYTVIYSGDDTYPRFVVNSTFLVQTLANLPNSNTRYVGEVVPLIVDLGNATGFVTFYVNNDTYVVELTDGIAYQEITNYTLGFNKVLIDYSGDNFYPSFTASEYSQFWNNWNPSSLGFNIIRKENLKINTGLIQNDYANYIMIHVLNGEGQFGMGSVTVDIDGYEVILDLVDGVAIYNISENDVIDEISVYYGGDSVFNPTFSSDFIRINNDFILNSDSYMFYFNQGNGGRLFDWVPDDSTLDVQGSIIAPGVSFYVNKPINIISSTHDGFVDFNTTAGSLFGENPGARFAITYGGSGSNVTGVNFHNTQIWIENATCVVLDNISNVIEDQRVGSGVGATSIRSNSSYITVKNSYFYTRNNGGSSTLVLAWANYCTLDNNTIVVEGDVGNLIYLTTFNVEIPDGVLVNSFNNITNNRIQGPAMASVICWGIVGSGLGIVIENNTIDMAGIGITGQFAGDYNNIYSPFTGRFVGNVLLSGCTLYASGLIENNYVTGDLQASDALVFDNNVIGELILDNCEAFNNSVDTGLKIYSKSYIVHDNTVNGSLIISSDNCSVYNNVVNGGVAFDATSILSLSNIQFYNNSIQGNLIVKNGRNRERDISNISIVNNTVYGSVNLLGTSLSQLSNNTIKSEDVYAVDLTNCHNVTVSGNVIYASELYGSDAVNNDDGSNVVVNNCPVNPDLVISADSIYVGDTLDVVVGFNSTASGNVKVIVNGRVYSVDVSEFDEVIDIPDLAADGYFITAIYDGDDYFGQAIKTINVNVSKFSPVLEISLSNSSVVGNLLVNVSIFGASGSVNILVDGEENILNLNEGSASFIVDNVGAGVHSVVAYYGGDARNEATYASTSIFIKMLFSEITDIIIDGDLNIRAVLKDSENNPIGDANVEYMFNNQSGSVVTDKNGSFIIHGQVNSKVEINYKGTDVLMPVSTSVTLTDVAPTRVGSIVDVSGLTCYAVDTGAGEKGKSLEVVLKDVNGNALGNVSVQFVLNGKTQIVNTDVNGTALLPVNIAKANTYTCEVVFLGDINHEASFKAVKIVVNKKKTSLVAKAKAFKVKTKTKMYTVTLKTTTKSVNGKTYLKSGKKVTLKVNGKTYTAKTNKKGKVTFKITKLNKKGKYTTTIKFSGDNTYKAATKKVKITVK